MQIIVALVFLAVWLLVLWFGSIAFEATGLERRKARFQALSALTGTGFTTTEAESVVNHPRRRSIATWLIVLGNAGIIAFLILVIMYIRSGLIAPSLLFIGVVIIILLAVILSIRFGIINKLSNAILTLTGKKRRQPYLETEEILYEAGRYGVVRLAVGEEATEGLTLRDTGFLERGISILAIERKDEVVSFPEAAQQLLAGDQLLCYGEVAKITGMKR